MNKQDRIIELSKAVNLQGVSHTKIGSVIGCSREYVRQTLGNSGLPRGQKPKAKPVCNICGKIVSCKTAILCKECYLGQKRLPRFEISCSFCGITLLRPLVKFKNNGYTHAFCTKEEQGKWVSARYGYKKGHK